MALTIFIRDLVVSGTHGVHEHEKRSPQRFKITVELEIAGDSKALASDQLEDTLDWSRLRDDIVHIVENETYDLMERLAMEIANKLLAGRGVAGAVVTIDKLDAFETGVPGVRLELRR
jgi:dihydroneopterin aldolase